MAIKFNGIGHIAIRCKNFSDEFNFYTKLLGFTKILDICDSNGEVWITYLRVKKGQYVELFHKTEAHSQKKYTGNNEQHKRSLFNVAFEVENLNEFNTYLKVNSTENGISNYLHNFMDNTTFIVDPEENEYEFLPSLID